MTTTAAAPSEICEADPAVIVPSGAKAGRSLARDSAVVCPARYAVVGAHHDEGHLALRPLDGDALSSKTSFFCAAAASGATSRELVLTPGLLPSWRC
jgi:hypothetical protein